MSSLQEFTVGFMPLLDAAILVVAHEQGFAEEQGVALDLMPEVSWANMRDRLAIGQFDAAHMLAPMPIATNLGLTPLSFELVVPMALGSGGNAFTVSNDLFDALGIDSASAPAIAGHALKAQVEVRREQQRDPLRFAVVHPHSAHNIELRYWLSACGIDPDNDIELLILPPVLMCDALAAQSIDGFCVGEPWNSRAELQGIGRILTTKEQIWASSPEKVLAISRDVLDRHEASVDALMRALLRAAIWCSDADNQDRLAALVADSRYLDADRTLVDAALNGVAAFEPFRRLATFPWQSHALWFYSQLVRWQYVEHQGTLADIARQTYRPDIYRRAMAAENIPLPGANLKIEGALTEATPVSGLGGEIVLGPDGFFDGHVFDPDQLDSYIDLQRTLHHS